MLPNPFDVLKSEVQGPAADYPFGYAGYMYDKEISMYYLMARYYHPVHGVFISVDPDPGDEDDPITQNGYTYADNNPVMHVDPDGHWVWLAINGGFAAYEGYKAYKSGQSWKGITAASLMGAIGGSRVKAAKHGDLSFYSVAENLSYGQARSLERRVYLKYGGKKSLRNVIRPIAKRNKNYSRYI